MAPVDRSHDFLSVCRCNHQLNPALTDTARWHRPRYAYRRAAKNGAKRTIVPPKIHPQWWDVPRSADPAVQLPM